MEDNSSSFEHNFYKYELEIVFQGKELEIYNNSI